MAPPPITDTRRFRTFEEHSFSFDWFVGKHLCYIPKILIHLERGWKNCGRRNIINIIKSLEVFYVENRARLTGFAIVKPKNNSTHSRSLERALKVSVIAELGYF